MFFSVLAVVLPLFSASVLATDCARKYVVAEGDTCDAISAAHNASTFQIAAANFGTINPACTNLQIGQEICLGNVGEDCTSTYVVQSGDYCDLIAGNFQTNFTMLRTNNPQIDDLCYNLYSGEVLCVATSQVVINIPEGMTFPPVSYDGQTGSTDAGSEYDGGSTKTNTETADVTKPAVSEQTGGMKDDDKKDEQKDDCDNKDTQEDAGGDQTKDEGDDDDLPYCDEI